MLDINNELLDNLSAQNLFPIDNDRYEARTILEKYNLQNDTAILNTIESQYSVITDFIIEQYLVNKALPIELKSFVQESFNYRIFLFDNIKDRMKKIIEESSVHFFKEIYILINLLSNGNSYTILTEENLFSINDLRVLLNDYEDNVCELFIKQDKQNFELTFGFYLALLELLNAICVVNSLDIQRRKNINSILELITNTITNVKSKIQLDATHIKSLNAILGKLLLYFTNMSYISIDSANRDVVIKKYAFMLNKIHDGYELLDKDSKYYLTFLDRVTTLILTLIYKLKSKLHIENMKFSESKDLNELYNLYNVNVQNGQKIEVDNLNDFRDGLLKNYNYLYSQNINKDMSNKDLIDYFISLDSISNLDMLIIHNIVLYSDTLEKEKLDLLLKSLIEKNRFDNDYYEFFKLKIIDRILQKYISLRISTKENLLIDEVIKYIEKNNLISHLMSMYSKIYLSLSLYYSYERTNESQEKSKNFYFLYQRLDNNNFLKKEFSSISKHILYNYAKNYFKQFSFKSEVKFTNEELFEIGRDLIKKYIKAKNVEIQNSSFIYIEKLIEEILNMNEPDDIWLNKRIESLISEKIFFGLVRVKIVNDDTLNIESIGYDTYKIELEEDYSLYLYYSSYYKSAFENLFEKNKDFVELITKNIFKTYVNNIPSYTDVITQLPNINKLKNELKDLGSKEITFFEVYLNAVVNFSESYNVNISNKFFRAVTSKINEETNAYRLFGPKIGIILEDDRNYKEVVEFLQNLKVQFEDEEFELKPIIAVSIGDANKILEKSFYALSSAKISNDKLYIFR